MTEAVRSRILSHETLIPVGVLMALLCPLIAGVWTVSATFNGVCSRLESLETAVKSDKWTYSMERDAWKEVAALNPAFKTPDFRRIHADNLENKTP